MAGGARRRRGGRRQRRLRRPRAEAPPAADERAWSLVSCVVTPGFAYEDFELAERDELVRLCPEQAELIVALT